MAEENPNYRGLTRSAKPHLLARFNRVIPLLGLLKGALSMFSCFIILSNVMHSHSHSRNRAAKQGSTFSRMWGSGMHMLLLGFNEYVCAVMSWYGSTSRYFRFWNMIPYLFLIQTLLPVLEFLSLSWLYTERLTSFSYFAQIGSWIMSCVYRMLDQN